MIPIRLANKSDEGLIDSILKECSDPMLRLFLPDNNISLLYEEKGVLISCIDEKEPWIWMVAVPIEFRGEGIAKSLVLELEKYYPDYNKINLYCKSDNPAQKLYFDCGYRVKKVIYDFYMPGDALKMVKELR